MKIPYFTSPQYLHVMILLGRYYQKPFCWREIFIHSFHIIPFFIFIFLSAKSTAQNPEWFSTGSTFTYVYQTIGLPDYYQTSLEISEQVVLNDEPCAKMELVENESASPFSCMVKPPPVYLFEQNDSVFYATDDDQEFRLLYDFNADIGEMWYIVVDHEFGFDSLEVEVLESEMINIEGNNLKQLTVTISPVESEDDVFIEPPFTPVRILEYAGALDFYFIIIGKNPVCDETTSESLLCYTSESLNYFADESNTCNLTNTSFKNTSEEIIIFPNPTSDHFSIKLPDTDLTGAELRLYDISGRLVFSEINYRSEQMISTTEFSPGLYILQMNSAEGSFSGKLVVD